MTTIASSKNDLWQAHLDTEGRIWTADVSGVARASGRSMDDFLGTADLSDLSLRVVGSRCNAPLLVRLHRLRKAGHVGKLEVCSPSFLGKKSDSQDPAMSMFRARSASYAPSLGGWHDFTDADYPSYAMCELFDAGVITGEDQERLDNLRVLHPAWKAVSWIHGLHRQHVCEVLANIRDPRWFVDRAHPMRSSRMEAYLGLRPKNMNAVLSGSAAGKHPQRCFSALWAWKASFRFDVDYRAPADFLHRNYAENGGRTNPELRTSSLFIRFIRHVWLSALYKGSSSVREDLFVPEYFFPRSVDALSFRHHMATFDHQAV